MRFWAGLFLVLALTGCADAGRMGDSLPISQWPVPATGSPDITNGDAFVGTRAGVSYKLLADFGGTCSTNQWVNSISNQGVPSCAQPGFGNLSGFLGLPQIAGAYTNGQLLIGSTTSGQLQAGTLAAGTNISVANSPGGISVGTVASPTFTTVTNTTQVTNGLSSANALISNGSAFSVSSGCGTVTGIAGGATAGSFGAGSGTCNPVMALPTASHGWKCSWTDITNSSATIKQTGYTTTSCTGTGASVSSADVILWSADRGF